MSCEGYERLSGMSVCREKVGVSGGTKTKKSDRDGERRMVRRHETLPVSTAIFRMLAAASRYVMG